MKHLNLVRALVGADEDECTCDTLGCDNTCSRCTDITGCVTTCRNSTLTTQGVGEVAAGLGLARHVAFLNRRLARVEAIFQTETGRQIQKAAKEEALRALLKDIHAELNPGDSSEED